MGTQLADAQWLAVEPYNPEEERRAPTLFEDRLHPEFAEELIAALVAPDPK